MLYKLPKLAYEILDLLSVHQTVTQHSITAKLDIDAKSIKYAIRRLQENHIIYQIPDLLDMRIVHYRFSTIMELKQNKANYSDEIFHDMKQRIQQLTNLPNENIKSMAKGTQSTLDY